MSHQRLRYPRPTQQRKKVSRAPISTLQTDSNIEHLLHLQRTLGNQATLRLVNSGMIQLGRKGKRKGKKAPAPTSTLTQTLSQEEIKKRIAAGQKKRAEEKAAKNSWGAWFAS